MVDYFESEYKEILDIIRENNNVPIVIEYENTELENSKGESVTVSGGYSNVMKEMERLYNKPNHIIKNVYMRLFTRTDVEKLLKK